MNEILHVSEEGLFMLLGEFALPTGNEDCAPVAQELIRRVNNLEWEVAENYLPSNWELL